MSTLTLKITGMTCEHCVRATTQALEKVPGVERAEVTLEPGSALVLGDADPLALIAAVGEAGYEAEILDNATAPTLLAGSDHVLLYTSPGCPDCAAVRRYLEAHHITYEERDVTAPGIADEAKSRYGIRVAPITVIDGEAIWGTFADQKPELDARIPQD